MPHTQRHKYALSVYILMVKLVKNSEQLPPTQLILADNFKIRSVDKHVTLCQDMCKQSQCALIYQNTVV
jgi:hypothetical protein